MTNFGTRISDGIDRAMDHLELALVPVLVGAIAFDRIGRIAAFDGGHVGFRFGFPLGVIDAWHFVSVPSGGGINVGPASIPLLVLGVAVRGLLGAGYYGSIRDVLRRGEYDFAGNVGRYASRFLVVEGVPALGLLVFAAVTVSTASPVFAVFGILAFLVLGYLFFAAPYLIVLRELDVLTAAAESYDLALDGGPYARYAAGYLAFVLVLSPFATLFVVTLGLLGAVVGVLALAPLGLALNVATMRFLADLDDDAPDLGSWDADAGDRPGRGDGRPATTGDGPESGGSNGDGPTVVDPGDDPWGDAGDDPLDDAGDDPWGSLDHPDDDPRFDPGRDDGTDDD